MTETERLEQFSDFVMRATLTAPETNMQIYPIPLEANLEGAYDFAWGICQRGPDQWEVWEFYGEGANSVPPGWTGPNSDHNSHQRALNFVVVWMKDFSPAMVKGAK